MDNSMENIQNQNPHPAHLNRPPPDEDPDTIIFYKGQRPTGRHGSLWHFKRKEQNAKPVYQELFNSVRFERVRWGKDSYYTRALQVLLRDSNERALRRRPQLRFISRQYDSVNVNGEFNVLDTLLDNADGATELARVVKAAVNRRSAQTVSQVYQTGDHLDDSNQGNVGEQHQGNPPQANMQNRPSPPRQDPKRWSNFVSVLPYQS